LLSQKLDLPDRENQSPDLKKKKDEFNQYISDLSCGDKGAEA
jgi:hypothetical protein